ncbi:unnamed protein product [Trichobilharzia regenti]|uniref:Sister chromatid cohesion protein DCC1 n=1 Tax=Trichobilharzia regenti TaxID=157069 RepID=A0A183WBP0_TRIRE|nr:unnamed protein product [Trichobilharzia regenti]VDQ05423.1 unnamed protein product [Trichobilharzia regenti]
MSTTRTYESMKELLECAKLDSSFTCNIFQSVKFDSSLSSEEYKLIEVPNSLADEIMKEGGNKVITLKDEYKPNNMGRVFACTNDKTFSVIEAETSNTLLLASNWWLPSTDYPKENSVIVTAIQAMKNNYFELHPCAAPSFRQLRLMLASSLYYGPVEEECESEDTISRPTYLDLETVQARLPCSKFELMLAFRRLRICEVDGHIRILDPEYLTQVIRDLFALADENAWDWRTHGFPVSASIEGLKNQHHPNVTKQIMALICAHLENRKPPDSKDTYVFPRNSQICQAVGEHLLAVINSFDLNDFLSLWKASVPNGLKPKLRRHLTCAGRAYCVITPIPSNGPSIKSENNDISSRFRCISLLRSEDLPDESVEARLSALFERSPMWPESELGSYIEELLPPQSSGENVSSKPFVQSYAFHDIADADYDSDFNYEDTCADSTESVSRTEDVPKPCSPAVGSLLSKLCRVSNSSFGRILTQRHIK